MNMFKLFVPRLSSAFVYTLILLGGLLGSSPLLAENENRLPAEYVFQSPEAKAMWRNGLPTDCVEVSPTCVYSLTEGCVYLLAEYCGLRKHYETEFILLGQKSDRAYEGLMIAWDDPSTVAQAIEALGVPKGEPAHPARGLPMAKGERFTVHVATLGKNLDFQPLETEVDDQWSTAAENLLGRGFPYVGVDVVDHLMPASIIATFTEQTSLFGMPYFADKSAVYGSFRAKETRRMGEPVVVALRWQRLPNGQSRVRNETLTLSKATVGNETLIETLKGFADDPRDVFLTIKIDPDLLLTDLISLSKLFQMIEQEGGFTMDVPPEGQLPLRAFTPNAEWLVREQRTFQPWEIELSPGAEEQPAQATLCQVEEDWSGEGLEPKLTRKCYPNVTAATIASVMDEVDVTGGRIYVAFFYCQPGLRVKEVLPYAEAIKSHCPTQWFFTLESPTSSPKDTEHSIIEK